MEEEQELQHQIEDESEKAADENINKTGEIIQTSDPKKGEIIQASNPKIMTEGSVYTTDSDLSDWETREFGKGNIKSPPMTHKNQSSDSEDYLSTSPGAKRTYDKSFDRMTFEATAEAVAQSPKRKHKEEGWNPGKENEIPGHWKNSVSSHDSALGSSLFSAYGSVLTESSDSLDSHSNSEDTSSSITSSPVHNVYGRYTKLYNDRPKSGTILQDEIETLVLHRLPGENIGMILGIEGGKYDDSVVAVRVKTVTIGGAAYRATGSSKGVTVGDQLLEVNGMDLRKMKKDECMTVLREMPLRVILTVKRESKHLPNPPTTSAGLSELRQKLKRVSSRELMEHKNERFMQNYSTGMTTSESEEDSMEGFKFHHVEIDKSPKESLGISIVPSYGSTREYYQVKRLLPSGAGARSGQLKVGDRLVSCNGRSLRNLSQAKCLSILKSEAFNGDLELEVLRQIENEIPMEISVKVENGLGVTGLKDSLVTLQSPRSDNCDFYPSGIDSESDSDVVLNSFHRNNEENGLRDVFVQNSVRLAYQNPVSKNRLQPSRHQLSDISDDPGVESDYSLKSQHQKLIHSKMSSAPFGTDVGDTWGIALPPPAEFSDDTGLTSETGTETGDENVPSTNIDDILSDYAPSLSNQESPDHHHSNNHEAEFDDFLTVNGDEKRHKPDILFQIEESPNENDPCFETNNDSFEVVSKSKSSVMNNNNLREQNQIMDIFDSYLTSGDETDGSLSSNIPINWDQFDVSQNHSKEWEGRFDNKQINPPSHNHQDWLPRNQTKSPGLSDVHHEQGVSFVGRETVVNADGDENIIPVSVKREMTVNNNWTKFQILDLPESSVDNDIDEEAIVPQIIEREKKVALNQSKPRDISPPTPSPRNTSPPKPLPKPRKKSKHASESDESVEETLIPVQIKKESSAKSMDEKFGNDMAEEQFIVPEEVKREHSWSGVQLVVMANKWTKKASENKENDQPGVSVHVIEQSDLNKENTEDETRVKIELPGSQPRSENVVNIEVSQADVQLPQEKKVVTKQPQYEPDAGLDPVVKNKVIPQDNASYEGKDIKIALPKSLPPVMLDVTDNKAKVEFPQPSQTVETINIVPGVSSSKQEQYDSVCSGLEMVEDKVKNVSIIAVESTPKVEVVSVDTGDVKSSDIEGKAQDSFDEKPEPIKIQTSVAVNQIHKSPEASPVPSPREKVAPTDPTISETQISVNQSKKEVSHSEISNQDKPVESAKVEVTKPAAQYKTVVPITTKPQSLLGTIRSQTSTGQMKPLSSIRPVKIDMKSLSLSKPAKFNTSSSISTAKPSLLSTLHGSSLSSGTKSTRSDDAPFQVAVMKGILGLGIKVKVTPEGFVQVTEVQSSGPIAKDGNIRTGDYILAINNTELCGLQDSKVQQILRLLPRGLAKIVASATSPDRSVKTDAESPVNSPSANSPVTVGTTQSPGPLTQSGSSPSFTMVTKVSDGSTSADAEKQTNIPSEVKEAQKKTPPKIAPKPKVTGGYAKSAADKDRVGGPIVSDAMESDSTSSTYSAPPSSSYVSSAKKLSSPSDKSTKDSKEPIDTIIFASVGNSKTDYISSAQKKFGSSPKAEDGPEPRMIPKGHVDYVMSAKPKSPGGPVSPVSPKSSYLSNDTNKSSSKLNSALSPRKSKDVGQFKYNDSQKFDRSSAPVRSGKDDQSPASDLDSEGQIDVVSMSQFNENVSSAPVTMETPLSVDVVHTKHASVSSGIVLESNVVDNDGESSLETMDKICGTDVDITANLSQAESLLPSQLDSQEGKKSSELNASVEVVHDGTKSCLSDVNLPANTDTVDINHSELPPPDSTDNQSPLTPLRSFPVVLNIAKEMAADTEYSDELIENTEVTANNDNSDIEVQDLEKPVATSDTPLIPPSEISQSNTPTEIKYQEEEIETASIKVTLINEPPPQVEVPSMFGNEDNPKASINTHGARDVLFPVSMSSSFDSPYCDSIPPACDDRELGGEPVSMSQTAQVDVVPSQMSDLDTNYKTVDYVLSQGFSGSLLQQQHDKDPDTKQQDNVADNLGNNQGNINEDKKCVNSLINVHSNDSSLDFILDAEIQKDTPTLDSLPDINTYETQNGICSKGDNFDSQDRLSDHSLLSFSSDQLMLPMYEHCVRTGTDTPDTRSLGSMDDLSESDYSVVKSKRRWSLIAAPQELSLYTIPGGSQGNDMSLEDSTITVISAEQLTTLLDSANDQMDQSGLSSEDEIAVVILHKQDTDSEIGLQLRLGVHDQAMISSVDPSSLAGKDGRLDVGDILLSINGEPVTETNLSRALNTHEQTMVTQIVLVVSKSRMLPCDGPPPLPSGVPPTIPSYEAPSPPDDVPPTIPSYEAPSSYDVAPSIPSHTEPFLPSDQPPPLPSDVPPTIPSYEAPSPPDDVPPTIPSYEAPSSYGVAPSIPPHAEPSLPSDQPPPLPSDVPPFISSYVAPSPPEDEPPPVPSDIPPSIPSHTEPSLPSDEPTSVPSDVSSANPSDTQSPLLDSVQQLEIVNQTNLPVGHTDLKVTSSEEILPTLVQKENHVPDVAQVETTKPFYIDLLSFGEDEVDDGPTEVLEVTMMKGVTGLGFLIEGGKASPKGDVPLTIKRIFKGGPADKCGQLKVKDEILQVNGEDVTEMRHSEAWQHLKFLDDGKVNLTVRRRVQE